MYCGIDIGTSSVKAVLMGGDQSIVASSTQPLTVSRPQPGWSEQDPDSWIAATGKALDQLAADNPAQVSAIRAIGLSGQMHGATLLGSDDQPLRPCILWNDGRSARECAELEVSEPAFRTVGGNIVMPGFTAPKLAWVKKNEAAFFNETSKVLLPKDYVRLWLTGDHVSDMSDSAGTLWLDVSRRDWSDALLAATGLDRSHMPRLVEGSEAGGDLRKSLRERWGISATVVVAGGGGDNAASACGVGVVAPGTAFASLGTSGVLFVSNERFSPNTDGAVHAFCHALPNTWHQMGVILSATDSLEWLARLTGTNAPDLIAELGGQMSGPSPVTFLPYLSGERTPHNDADIRGAFVGIGHDTGRDAVTRAVLDGVAMAFRDCLDVLAAAGTEVRSVMAVGGGSRSRLWLEILATVLGVPIDVPGDGDFGGAFGAARLAMTADTGADPVAVCTKPTIVGTIEPNGEFTDDYAAALRKYRALYPALKEIET